MYLFKSRAQLPVQDKICELLRTRDKLVQKTRDNVRRDRSGEIPDVPDHIAQTEGMETHKHPAEHSRALPLCVKQTGVM